jgi:threonine synthase
MKFYSTRDRNHLVSFEEAVTNGLAPDSGLYMPHNLTPLDAAFIDTLSSLSFKEISFEVARHFLKDDFTSDEIQTFINNTISFDAPVVNIHDDIFALELFHGPTLAFKDFGARFMAQVVGHYAKQSDKHVTILVATSGDTGSAVANGFMNVEGVRVVILYPSGRVSEMQEKQFTTLGGNITAIEIDGTFDDCQRIVKDAFADTSFKSQMGLTSANSINLARLIPQSFYYFYAAAQLGRSSDLVFSVPSGNFGNLTAGLLATKMGLPLKTFVVATNANDIIPKYLETGTYEPRQSIHTASNAMDVGTPSNFERIQALYQSNLSTMSNELKGYAITDEETMSAIDRVFAEHHYLLDPHGAVGYAALRKYLRQSEARGIFLATAHPGKFVGIVEQAINESFTLPDTLKDFLTREKRTIKAAPNLETIKEIICGLH